MSVVARLLEEAGLTTTAIALIREHAEKVKPPRALFVPFALGFPLGKPNDPDLQHRVIAGALDLVWYDRGPVLVDFPEDATPALLLQASFVQRAETTRSAADEVTALRAFYERWIEGHGGTTAVGLCGIPQRRFRGIVRFLEAYVRGEEADMPERPAQLSLEQFIRFCADDLKAFFYEARMVQNPDAGEKDLHHWFWGETAAGRLLVAVAERMKATGDPAMNYMAHGIIR